MIGASLACKCTDVVAAVCLHLIVPSREGGDAVGLKSVVPAKAGTHFATVKSQWIPAFAGMTNV